MVSAASNMALQRTRRPRFRSGRSLCSLGSPLNARPLATQKRLFGGAILVALALATPTALFACTCGHKATAAESLSDSSRVFEGEALWIEPAWALVPDAGYKFPLRRWRFRVLRVWKGSATPEAVVVDAFGNCSYGFTSGKTYLVFGRQHPTLPSSLQTTICTATREVAGENSRELGPGTVVETFRPLGPEPLLRRARRVVMTSWYTGLAFAAYQWRQIKERSPAGALLFSYISALVALLLIGLAVRDSIRGHFKRVALVAGAVSVATATTLLALGGWHASRNPFLHELIRLGG
jgi:hypothetical protein